MNKFNVFKEMLNYVSLNYDVTDADMNYCGNTIHIEGETEEQTITIEVFIKNKEANTDGN